MKWQILVISGYVKHRFKIENDNESSYSSFRVEWKSKWQQIHGPQFSSVCAMWTRCTMQSSSGQAPVYRADINLASDRGRRLSERHLKRLASFHAHTAVSATEAST